MNLFTGGHHHTTTNGVWKKVESVIKRHQAAIEIELTKRVRSNTGTSGDTPSEEEGGQETAFKGTSEHDGFERIVHPKAVSKYWVSVHASVSSSSQSDLLETTVDDDTDDGGNETTVKTGDTIGGNGLLVDIE